MLSISNRHSLSIQPPGNVYFEYGYAHRMDTIGVEAPMGGSPSKKRKSINSFSLHTMKNR